MSTDLERGGATIRVEVAYATPERQLVIGIDIPARGTLEEAIERSGIRAEFPGLKVDPTAVGIFGRKAHMGQVLSEGDRVEIYRPLIADPKEARRRRAEQKENG